MKFNITKELKTFQDLRPVGNVEDIESKIEKAQNPPDEPKQSIVDDTVSKELENLMLVF